MNDLPATPVLLQVLGDRPAPALVLAMLLGMNIGPNLTSWVPVQPAPAAGARPPRTPARHGKFSALGMVGVPLTLAAAVVALRAVTR